MIEIIVDNLFQDISKYLMDNCEVELLDDNIEKAIHKIIDDDNSCVDFAKYMDFPVSSVYHKGADIFRILIYYFDQLGYKVKLKSFFDKSSGYPSYNELIFNNPFILTEENFEGMDYLPPFTGWEFTWVKLPDSILTMDSWAFSHCKYLEYVGFSKNLSAPESFSAFCGCWNLKSAEFPNDVKYLIYAFSSCHNLRKVDLPDSVEEIDKDTFVNCSKLNELILPLSLEKIGYGVFSCCSSLTDIKYKGTVRDWLSIKKKSGWNANSSIERVICSDGTIKV